MKGPVFVLLLVWLLAVGRVSAAAAPAGQAAADAPPILVLVDEWNPFSGYYAEILLAEGLNAFTVMDLARLTADSLRSYDVVILGRSLLSEPQVALLTEWVAAGGNLIAMRPDPKLGELLGLGEPTGTLSDAYLQVDTSSGPGVGLVSQTMRFHGTADCYPLRGATAIATLYADADQPTACPAVTRVDAGAGGQAAAFTFDLSRSIVYTRQGNPQWSGQDRDGSPPIRPNDLFYGNFVERPAADWVDVRKVAIPAADEQQRLLANLIVTMNRARKPLPRFWYFPGGKKAVVVMTGDDHGAGGTAGRFDAYKARSAAGCSVADWECVRSTSYVYPTTPFTDAQAAAYTADGFEVALHVNTDCGNWTPESLEAAYTGQLAAWKAAYPSLPAPVTNRTHCVAWSDYVGQPQVELAHGIRLDTNYYHYPAAWVGDRPGFLTGSGMPMRFARADGTTIDVYQAATQMTDESGQAYPDTVVALLDRAVGPEAYYGVFTANIHTDQAASDASDAIIAAAQARAIPVVSAHQMLEWLDGRNRSSFNGLSMSANTLSFSVASPLGSSSSAAGRLQALLPIDAAGGTLVSVAFNGKPLSYSTQTIKGIAYALFKANPGEYRATYSAGVNPQPGTTTLDPAEVPPGGAAFTLHVNGTGFVPASIVRWNGASRPTTFISSTRLDVAISAADIARGTSAAITVFSPPPGGGLSGVQALAIANPVPTIAKIAPETAPVGSAGLTLTIEGRGFLASSVARVNGADRPTELISPSQITVRIPAADLGAAGMIPITVFNRRPGGGLAPPAELVITSPRTLLIDGFDSPIVEGWAVSPFSPLRKSGWSVADKMYRYDGGGHTQACRGEASWTDYQFDVGIRLTTLSNHPGGFRGRYNPLTGSGYAVWQYPGSGQIILYRVTGWSIDSPGLTQLGVADGIQFDTKFHKLGISFRGPSISVYRDGALIISATDATYSHGMVGFDVSNQAVEFDNVVVTDLVPKD